MMIKKLSLFFWLVLFPLITYASFIETTIGPAVANDATASYYNPAALMLLKNSQIIPQWTVGYFHTRFVGQSTLASTGNIKAGSSSSNTRYYSPTFYLGIPITDRVTAGLAVVTNSAHRNADESSILRYVQSNNTIQDYDVVPGLSIKINESLSIGGGINFSYANFNLRPITGFPGSNIVDSQNTNQSEGSGIGANAGVLLKLSPKTVMGFNYRTLTTYKLSGKSIYGNPRVVSNDYHYKMRTPARSIFSINHFFTDKFGLISTIQYIEWSTMTNVHVYGIASVSGTTPVILNGDIPDYLRNTWLFTLGNHYRITPKWILRVAGTYNQSAGNPHYQISNGDSISLGASTGYEINKTFTIDGSFSHVFIKNQNINIKGGRFLINGVNEGSRNTASLKLTVNI